MSKDEIRAWLCLRLVPVKGTILDKKKTMHPERLTLPCIARHLGLSNTYMWELARGKRRIHPKLQKMIGDFIGEWEAGYWRVEFVGFKKSLKRNVIPQKKTSFTINLGNMSLNRVQNVQPMDKMPQKLWRE
jgi:hypothetical protein